MDFGCYLAMTAAEFSACRQINATPAWMACHYASYTLGLSNLPTALPEGAMVIVNDRIPPNGHDAQLIKTQLQALCEEHGVGAVLLDLQRAELPENKALVKAVSTELPCPVGVSSLYAEGVTCPVFLSCPPPHVALASHLASWTGQEVWLELAMEAEQAVVTEQGAHFSAWKTENLALPHGDEKLHCRYCTEVLADRAVFTLRRGQQELTALAREARDSGVTRIIGLYQQLGKDFPWNTEDRR